MSTTSIDLLTGGLLQGTIDGNGGFLPNTTRVIMTTRMALPNFVGRSYVVSATTSTGKTINTDFVGYADSTTQMFIYDSDWQSNPKTYDLSSQTSINYFRIVLKYSDNSSILPEEITALTLSDTAVWHAAEGQYPINDLTPPLLQTDFRRPFPASLWRIDENNGGYPYTDYHLGVIYAAPPVPPPPEPESDPVIFVQYDIYCDNQLMHSSVVPAKEWKVIDPVLDLQDSAAGSLEFSLPKFNCMYGKCQMMMSTISVRRNGAEIWEGRPVSFKEDMWLNHAVTCEGELAYLNDICQEQNKYENNTLPQIITAILSYYNARCRADRRFELGECELPEIQTDTISVTIPYESTLQAINDLAKAYNMHIYLTNEWNNGVKTRKISFFNDGGQLLGNNASQKIEFGRNLVDYAKSYNFSSLVTVVLPLGAKSNKAGVVAKDTDAEFNILSASIVQGSIKSDGTDKDATNRIRTGFINITSGADTITIDVSGNNVPPGQTLQFALELYSGNTVSTFVREYEESSTTWFNMPKTIDLASYGATHARLVFRFSGNNDILPSYITSGTISVTKTRHGTPYGTANSYGRGYIIWPKDGYDSRNIAYKQEHNTNNPSYWHNAGDIVYLLASGMSGDFNIPDNDRLRYFVREYDITSTNSTVYITTQMNHGVGMTVVHNSNSHYYLKKAGSSAVLTAWTELKFNGWYEGYEGTTKLYVGGYDATSADPSVDPGDIQKLLNSKIVDEGLEEYVTVKGIGGPDVSPNIVDELYVIDNNGAPVGERPVDIYGRIERKIDWSDVKDGWTLYQNAITYLRSDQFNGLQIELTALDMSMLGFKASQLKVGEKVNVSAPVYGLSSDMPVTAIKIPLTKPEETTYTVGSKNKQNLTSVNNSTNSELLSLIAEKPSMSAVLATAKQSAAEYLLDTQNGYVTMRYGENGHPEAIIISDNEDYTMSSSGYWIFGRHGIGYVEAGKSEASEYTEAKVAMTSDGQIVADWITAGTMSAERIFGDTLKLGLLGTESGNMKVYDGSLSNQVAQIDKDGIKQWSGDYWVRINDGCVRFGDDRQSETNGIFIKGNGSVDGADEAIEIYADANTSGTTMLGIATDRIGIWIPGSGSGGSDAYGFGVDTTVQVRNKDLSFHKGILTDVDDHSGGGLPSGQFTIGDTTYHFTDGLIDRVTVNPNNS